MVSAGAAAVARLVARASPVALAIMDATCRALEADGGGTKAIEALRQSCDVRRLATAARKRRR